MFQDESNPTTVARARSTSKQMIAYFFGKTGHVAIVPPEQRRTVNSVVWQLSSKKAGKSTAEDGSLFTTTMRALTHRLKQLHF